MIREAYRFVSWPSIQSLAGSCIVLDSAIEEAKVRSRKSDPGTGIGVMDHDRNPPLLRGVAQNGVWSWANDCKPCGGHGHTAGGFMGAKIQCVECKSTGRRPENFRETT